MAKNPTRTDPEPVRARTVLVRVGTRLSDVLWGVQARSSLYLRSRQYNCVRVIPNRRAAFDLFQALSWRTCSIVRRSTSDRCGGRSGATTLVDRRERCSLVMSPP